MTHLFNGYLLISEIIVRLRYIICQNSCLRASHGVAHIYSQLWRRQRWENHGSKPVWAKIFKRSYLRKETGNGCSGL
jgi:hypothetical protein